jgi:hypothetical protein
MFKVTRPLIIATAIGGLMLAAGTAMAGQKAEINDLMGRDAVKAIDIMTSRGFKSVDTYNSPDDHTVIWWYNARTGQCVNTQSDKNRVIYVVEERYPKCNEAAGQAGGSEESAGTSSKPSKKAKKACGNRFGGNSDVKSFTPLKPGWWEIILTGNHGRKVACTVNDDGTIDDWVEMK